MTSNATRRVLTAGGKCLRSWPLALLLMMGFNDFGFALDPKYPDGSANQTSIITKISAAQTYTVPSGENMYIVSVTACSQTCGPLPLSCHLTAGAATNILDPFSTPPSNPILLGPGTIIASTSSAIVFDINGFVMPATVTTVLTDLPPFGSYVVPQGSNLYLMRVGRISTASDRLLLMVGGVRIFSPSSEPTLIAGGETISNQGSSLVTLIGYLQPQ